MELRDLEKREKIAGSGQPADSGGEMSAGENLTGSEHSGRQSRKPRKPALRDRPRAGDSSLGTMISGSAVVELGRECTLALTLAPTQRVPKSLKFLQKIGQISLDFHEISPEFHQNFTELAAPNAKSRP